MSRQRPTEMEANILLDAQRDYIHLDDTKIKCPRCGKQIEYVKRGSGSITRCIDETCIQTTTRGL